MKDINILRDKSPLTDKDIEAGRDFNSLMKQYQTSGVPQAPKQNHLFTGMVSAVVVILITVAGYFYISNNKQTEPTATKTALPFISYTINASQGDTITTTAGWVLNIPPFAFTDAQGNTISGNVEIQYREFTNAADIFLSNIDMTYDSTGQEYHFESAGMMEIYASYHGAPVNVNKASPIQASLPYNRCGEEFNIYYYDTTQNNWQYINAVNCPQGMPSMPPIESVKDTINIESIAAKVETLKEEIAQLLNTPPLKPVERDDTKPAFTINADENEFPEMKAYKNIKFQVIDAASFKAEKSAVAWEDVLLEKTNDSHQYKVTFKTRTETLSILATPVFGEGDMAAANKVYKEKFAKYSAELNARRREEAELNKLLARQERMAEQMRAIAAQEQQKEMERPVDQRLLTSFTIYGFGLWNCDMRNIYPIQLILNANFVDADGNEIKASEFYLYEKYRTGLFRYTKDGTKRFGCNPKMQNIVWAKTKDGQLAIVSSADFAAAINGAKGTTTFKMNVFNPKNLTNQELKAKLEL